MQDQITYKYKFDRTNKFYSCIMLFDGKHIELLSNETEELKLTELYDPEERRPNITTNQRSNITQNLKNFIVRVNSLELQMNESNFAVLYSHSVKGNTSTMNHLSFEIDESHMVSINDYIICKQFGNIDHIESYKLLNERLLNHSEYPYLKFKTQDVVIFEEEIEVEKSNCKYWGFKDKEPYDKHKILFETTRNNLQQIVNGMIEYRSEMKN